MTASIGIFVSSSDVASAGDSVGDSVGDPVGAKEGCGVCTSIISIDKISKTGTTGGVDTIALTPNTSCITTFMEVAKLSSSKSAATRP